MQTPHTNSNMHASVLKNILIYVLHVLAIASTPYFDLNNLDFFFFLILKRKSIPL